MLKKLLLLTLLIYGTGLNAQVCTPSPIAIGLGIPGPFPNPQIGPLPDGDVGTAYSQNITFIVPGDTTIDLSQFGLPLGVFTVSINYMEVTNVTGLAPGLTTACNPANCQFDTSHGCMKISGTPTVAGVYTPAFDLAMNIDVPGFGAFTTPGTPVTYDHTVNGPGAVQDLRNSGFRLDNNSPNPFNGSTVFSFYSPNNADYNFTINDVTGKQIFTNTVKATAGENKFTWNSGNHTAGLYFFRFEKEGAFATGKMVITE